MFEWLQSVASAWRTILHISEWSGLSIGALGAGAVLVYFVPLARKFVIGGAVLVLVGWVCLIHGDKVGRADVHAQWDEAKAAAVEAQKARDATIGHELEQKYQPQLAELQKQSDERKARADSYERKIIALLAKTPTKTASAGRCELGDAALRMHGRP
jgi:hypothetical protein